MIPQCKQNENDFKRLEQKYNSIKKFTDSTYVNQGKIELELTTGTYLFWIATSGGGQTPSLILENLGSKKEQHLSQGGMHGDISWDGKKLTITLKNGYALYGYIKLR